MKFVKRGWNPASGPDGTSPDDLTDLVGSGIHSVPVSFITDHRGEVDQLTEPDNCRYCGEPMQDHAQWNITKQRVAATHDVDVESGDLGHSGVCSCGWVGTRRMHPDYAQDDAEEHKMNASDASDGDDDLKGVDGQPILTCDECGFTGWDPSDEVETDEDGDPLDSEYGNWEGPYCPGCGNHYETSGRPATREDLDNADEDGFIQNGGS